jgi:anti-sigma-K factor RskA
MSKFTNRSNTISLRQERCSKPANRAGTGWASMSGWRRMRVLGTAVLAVGLAMSPCFAAGEVPKHGGVLTYAVVADTFTYDCHAAETASILPYVAHTIRHCSASIPGVSRW